MESQTSEDTTQLLQQAIAAANGHYPEAEIQLSLSLARMKNWPQVEKSIARLSLRDCSPSDLMTFAKLCLDSKQWDIAESVFDALREMPVPAEEFLWLSCAFFQGKGNYPELIGASEQLTKVAPNDPRYWWLLARIHEHLENFVAAIRVYEAALAHDLPAADKHKMQHRLVEHSLHVGDAVRAREQLEILRKQGEHGPRIKVAEARLCHLEGHPDLAFVALKNAIQELGEVPEALRLRGILNLELGHVEQSISDLKRVVELTPQDEIALFKLAEAYRRLDHDRLNEQNRELANRYHERYLKVHHRQLRINQIKRQLGQTPEDIGLRSELQRLSAEMTGGLE